MFAIPTSLSRAGNDVMSTVSAAATTITASVSSLSALAESAQAHAEAYRDDTRAALAESAEAKRKIRVTEIKADLSERMFKIEERLSSNPRMRELFDQLEDKDFDFRPSHRTALSVAAE